MLLAIDVGNTETVIGVFDDAATGELDGGRAAGELPGLVHHWRVSTVDRRTADELALMLSGLFSLADIAPCSLAAEKASTSDPRRHVTGIAVSSSVPNVTAALRGMAERWFDVPLVVVQPGIKSGMPIRYENPREVGADRIVNAVAALDLYGAPLIVVDLGTATTFDVLSAAGEYLGGAIVPGMAISMEALVAQTALLRRVELVAPKGVIGRTTVESIQAGTVLGHAALVDGLCQRIVEEIGPAQVIATGGLGTIVIGHAKAIRHYEPWLTLHGLRLLFARNAGEPE